MRAMRLRPRPFDRESALLRGALVHRLMQSLPDIAPEFRAEAARRYLARAEKKLDQDSRDKIAAQVFAILDNPGFAPLFAQGSRAEVPIVGRPGTFLVSGQVDRLVVTDDAVLIADYKTNRPAPANLDESTENTPRLCTPACALSGGSSQRLSRPHDPGSPDLDGQSDFDGYSSSALDAEFAMLTPA